MLFRPPAPSALLAATLVCSFAALEHAKAAPPAAARALAPGQPDFVDRRRSLEEKLARADAVGTALARVHNALATLLASPPGRPCDTEKGRSLAARTRPLGAAYRDAAQAARADAARLRSLLSAPTLAPLLQPQDREAAELLLRRSGAHARQYLEVLAWQGRFVEPTLQRCQPKLTRAEGLPAATPLSPEADAAPVAVLGFGGGKVCPGNFAADGRVLVLRSPKACYAAASCTCEPRPVLPGAVLGPPAASGP